MATSEWVFRYLLPSVNFRSPVEHGPLAIVPHDDERLVPLAEASTAVRRLLGRFTNQFGEEVKPSALLIKTASVGDLDFYALSSFRNIVALASVIDALSMRYSSRHGSSHFPAWSDYFDFYPFTLTTDGNLFARSPASSEENKPGRFSGQKSPHLPGVEGLSFGMDPTTLDLCLPRWDRFLPGAGETPATKRLFRALEVAYRAMEVPGYGNTHTTIHEIGVNVALWVSAFEVLSHPGTTTGSANLGTVWDQIGAASWNDARLSAATYPVVYPKNNPRNINVAQCFYHQLYKARNAYLHGNPVTRAELHVGGVESNPPLLHVAPLVFRAALEGHVAADASIPPATPPNAGEELLRYSACRKYEQAIAKCAGLPKQ